MKKTYQIHSLNVKKKLLIVKNVVMLFSVRYVCAKKRSFVSDCIKRI